MSLAVCEGRGKRDGGERHQAIATEANVHGGFICPVCEAEEKLRALSDELDQTREELKVARKRIVELENLRENLQQPQRDERLRRTSVV